MYLLDLVINGLREKTGNLTLIDVEYMHGGVSAVGLI